MKPLVSVIVPVYNVEKYLDKCIESIVKQTYENLEIILVDDGSPDGCPQICDKWAVADERIKAVHKKNGGVSSARNAGLHIATGKYVGFVDGDDFIQKNMFEYLMTAIRSDRSQMSVCGYRLSGRTFCSDENQVLTKHEAVSVLFNIKDRPDFEGFVWNKLYVLDIIRKNKLDFSEDLSMCEDTLFNFNYLNHIESVSVISFCGYEYTFRKDSVMRLKPLENDFRMIGLIEYFLDKTDQGDIKDNVIRWAFKYWIKAADNYFVFKKGKEYCDKSISAIKSNKKFILNDPYFTRVEKLFTILVCDVQCVYRLYKKTKYLKKNN